MTDLLRLAADTMRDGASPFDHGFLAEHEVTLDEVYGLAEWLAVAVDVVLELDRTDPGRRMIGVALASGAGMRTGGA